MSNISEPIYNYMVLQSPDGDCSVITLEKCLKEHGKTGWQLIDVNYSASGWTIVLGKQIGVSE